ncbi:MAG TPA: quinol:electron acceptor oxidoreductase subunit ActD [Ignavibacteriaceae bacterium]|nr:quinol:electron acceptor oxidoreductase subunit ActD [Ignavibacteriaceae bacterium]
MNNEKKIYGITALFKSPDEIISAAGKVADAGYKKFDVNTPYPVHGMDRAMKLKPSRLGFVTLVFGLSGAALALIFMYWTMSVDYPMVIGGKPFFALPAFIPVTFEVTVLLATVMTVVLMLALFFRLPDNKHPLQDTNYMKLVSKDHYGVIVESSDPQFDENKVKELLKSLNPVNTEVVYYPVEEKYPVFQPKFLMFLFITVLVVSGGTYFLLNKVMYMTPFDWMMEQDKLTPQKTSELFSDGFGMRKPVEGSVARGFIPYPFMGEDNPKEVLMNPFIPTKENIELGRKKYLTFCSPCHGDYGDGDSRLKGQFPNPPTLHSTRGREFSDGMIYHIITNGQNIMPGYSSQISRDERWAVVNYIRVLQRAKNASDSDLELAKKETGSNGTN